MVDHGWMVATMVDHGSDNIVAYVLIVLFLNHCFNYPMTPIKVEVHYYSTDYIITFDVFF